MAKLKMSKQDDKYLDFLCAAAVAGGINPGLFEREVNAMRKRVLRLKPKAKKRKRK